MKRWIYSLSGLAALAFALPAFAQQSGITSSSSSGGSTGGGSTGGGATLSGLSTGTGGSGTSTGSSSFGIGSSGTSSGSGFGLNSSGTSSGTGSSQGTGSTGTAYNNQQGMYNSGRNSQGTFFPGPTASNPLASYYYNPLNFGNVNASKKPTFGQPMYATVTATNTGGGGGGRGAGGGLGSSSGASTVPPSPRYTIGIDFGNVRPTGVASGAQANVQRTFTQSSMFASNNIQVGMDRGALVLRGRVATDYDRRRAEGLARLSPGVNTVRNELQIGP